MFLILEWAGFIGVLLGTWLYGNQKVSGPLVCLVSALILIIVGLVRDIHPLWLTNIIFAVIHSRNAYKLWGSKP